MAHNPRFMVDGFEFMLNVGVMDADGVVIRPGKNDESDPKFIVALMKMLRYSAALIEACDLDEMADYYMRPDTIDDFIQNVPENVLEQYLKSYEVALTSDDFIPVKQSVHKFAALLESIKERRANKIRNKRVKAEKAAKQSKGFVYLIQSQSGAYKIGRTKNPNDRLKTFNVKLPFEVEFICLIETANMHALEAELHEQFSDKRVNGEWFNLNSDDVEYIKGLAA
jgi:Meiotically up-regulated gene 113